MQLDPGQPIAVDPGDTVQVIVYLAPGGTLTAPDGWTPGRAELDTMFGTRACTMQEMSIVAGAGFAWPDVSGEVVAWTWFAGRPEGPEGGFSWPQSGTVTAA